MYFVGLWSKKMKIASIVDSTALSQNVFYMNKTFNRLAEDSISPFCFYINLSTQAVKSNFSTLNCYYGNHYSGGPILATSLSTLAILINLNIKADKFFYCWDLEWLYLENSNSISYSDNIELFRNAYITLVARSKSHAELIENYANKKVSYIISDWDYEKIKGLCYGKSENGYCERVTSEVN